MKRGEVVFIAVIVGFCSFAIGLTVGASNPAPDWQTCVAYSPSTGECVDARTIEELVQEVRK